GTGARVPDRSEPAAGARHDGRNGRRARHAGRADARTRRHQIDLRVAQLRDGYAQVGALRAPIANAAGQYDLAVEDLPAFAAGIEHDPAGAVVAHARATEF